MFLYLFIFGNLLQSDGQSYNAFLEILMMGNHIVTYTLSLSFFGMGVTRVALLDLLNDVFAKVPIGQST